MLVQFMRACGHQELFQVFRVPVGTGKSSAWPVPVERKRAMACSYPWGAEEVNFWRPGKKKTRAEKAKRILAE